jgi:hypothetical protein
MKESDGAHDWTPKEGQTGTYHFLEIVCSNTPRKNNDPRSNRVEKSEYLNTERRKKNKPPCL